MGVVLPPRHVLEPTSFISINMKITLLLTLPLSVLLLNSCQTTPDAPAVDRFAQADRNADGELTEAEFNDYAVGNIFSSRDANSDGKMTRAEWNPDMGAEETKQFALRDADKDGVVTFSEASAYALKVKRFTGDWKAADTNHNGTVSRPEGVAFYASKEGSFR